MDTRNGAFLRLDWAASSRDVFRVNVMAGSSPFQLANLRSQHANGMQQSQLLRDFSNALAWVHTIDARTTWDSNIGYRAVSSQLYDSAGDTPVTSSQARRHSTFTIANRFNTIRGAHNIRAGFDYQRYPVKENFSFAITDPGFNPPGTEDYNPNLLPYDLTRGGRRFYFFDKNAGAMYSGYAQDNMRFGRWQLSLGLRYDAYRFLANGNQLQPRVGISFDLKETGTVFRASYNRLFQTPPSKIYCCRMPGKVRHWRRREFGKRSAAFPRRFIPSVRTSTKPAFNKRYSVSSA